MFLKTQEVYSELVIRVFLEIGTWKVPGIFYIMDLSSGGLGPISLHGNRFYKGHRDIA
jgi:hypothetical protein